MTTTQQNLEAIRDIRQMMERSSRFISLSGWSGVAAGTSALIGAWLAIRRIDFYYSSEYRSADVCPVCLRNDLLVIAGIVFFAATVSAFLFTWLRSRKEGIGIWGNTARRLLWNTLIPLIAGGFILIRMVDLKQYELIAGASLIIYGIALINGSKYTLGEVRYLGYAEIVTGIISLWMNRYGIFFWAFGFGVLHIIYGITMWWKYERGANTEMSAAL